MKLHALTLIVGLAAGLTPALAQTEPTLKAPSKTMGDQGPLPTTETMGSQIPHMGTAPEGADESSGPVTQKGPAKTMGNEGKLPATGTMGGAVPEMGGREN
jgi:hypothetical protein